MSKCNKIINKTSTTEGPVKCRDHIVLRLFYIPKALACTPNLFLDDKHYVIILLRASLGISSGHCFPV